MLSGVGVLGTPEMMMIIGNFSKKKKGLLTVPLVPSFHVLLIIFDKKSLTC
jgi:hypothetical protein